MNSAFDYLIRVDNPGLLGEPAALAGAVADRVLRADLARPGFALLDPGEQPDARAFRALLVALARALGGHYRTRFGGDLVFLSLSRFDQQASTRPHRDGGPDESVLLLGYEPTALGSRLFLYDYTRCALDRGLTSAELLARFNPAFGANQELLRDYTTPLREFRHDRHQVLVINNSTRPFEERRRGMLGVLHQAVMTASDLTRSRVINSLLLATAEAGDGAGLSAEAVQAFVDSAAAAAV